MEENKPAQTVPENINPTRPISEVSNNTVSPDNTFEKPKPKFSISAIIGIIIFLLLAGGGAAASFTIFKPQIMKLVSKPTPTPTPVVSKPSPTLNPTIDTAVYEGNGFSFAYPKTYQLEKEENGTIFFSGTFEPGNQKIPSELIVNTFQSINSKELKSCKDVNITGKYQCLSDPTEEVEINNIKFRKLHIARGEGTSQASATYVVQTTNKPEIEFIHKVLGGGVENMMDKILSTFKFTENSADNQLLLERQDADTRDALVEFSNANIRYYTTHAGFPWSVAGPCQSSATTNPQGITLGEIVPCINLLINEGELKGSFLSASEQSIAKIFVTSQDTNLNICYKPSSIKEQVKPETIYDVYGKVDKSCSTTGNKCFWCAQ